MVTIPIYFMKVNKFFASWNIKKEYVAFFQKKFYIFNCLIKINSQTNPQKKLVKFSEVRITYFIQLLYFIEYRIP